MAVEFDRLIQLKNSYRNDGSHDNIIRIEQEANIIVNDTWTQPTCSCGNLLTIVDIGGRCRECRAYYVTEFGG
jgi:hypothetical protein